MALGDFEAEDRILVIYNDGTYEITDQELTQRFNPEEVLLVEKFDPERIITAVYLDGDKLQYNVKRFRIETTSLRTRFLFIKEGEENHLEAVSTEEEPVLIVQQGKGSQVRKAKFKIAKMVEVMGWKAVGAKLVDFNKTIQMEWEVKEEVNKQPELF
ncbi:MAG: DNA gyrase/topoisomerase IV subunit A, partial [Flavisolibacter sp.]|nr:DNA gyrase/topoisomerase IV subunit A [Flavisolibacter sp.]